MTRQSQKFLTFFILLAFLGGCGAAASLAPTQDNSKLAGRLSEAVWYSEKGNQEITATSADSITAEDGVARTDSILVIPSIDSSTYVQGAFSINVPDQEGVKLNTKVGFPAGITDQAIFRVYVQNGVNFPMLAEVTAVSDGQLDEMNVDLSQYRGQNILLILSVSSLTEAPFTSASLWIQPQLVTP